MIVGAATAACGLQRRFDQSAPRRMCVPTKPLYLLFHQQLLALQLLSYIVRSCGSSSCFFSSNSFHRYHHRCLFLLVPTLKIRRYPSFLSFTSLIYQVSYKSFGASGNVHSPIFFVSRLSFPIFLMGPSVQCFSLLWSRGVSLLGGASDAGGSSAMLVQGCRVTNVGSVGFSSF